MELKIKIQCLTTTVLIIGTWGSLSSWTVAVHYAPKNRTTLLDSVFLHKHHGRLLRQHQLISIKLPKLARIIKLHNWEYNWAILSMSSDAIFREAIVLVGTFYELQLAESRSVRSAFTVCTSLQNAVISLNCNIRQLHSHERYHKIMPDTAEATCAVNRAFFNINFDTVDTIWPLTTLPPAPTASLISRKTQTRQAAFSWVFSLTILNSNWFWINAAELAALVQYSPTELDAVPAVCLEANVEYVARLNLLYELCCMNSWSLWKINLSARREAYIGERPCRMWLTKRLWNGGSLLLSSWTATMKILTSLTLRSAGM